MVHIIRSKSELTEIESLYKQSVESCFEHNNILIDESLGFFKKREFLNDLEKSISSDDYVFLLDEKSAQIVSSINIPTSVVLICTNSIPNIKLVERLQKKSQSLQIILPSEFAQKLTVQSGISENLLHVVAPYTKEQSIPERILNQQSFALGVIANLEKNSGIETILQALHKVREILPHLKLIIIGDGSEKKQLHWLIDHLHLKTRVQIVSSQENYQKFLINFDVLILPNPEPSLFEPKILYAYQAGVPVIATNIGCHENLIEHGKSGLLYEPGNTHTLEQHIINLCNHEDWMNHYKKIGPEMISSLFNKEIFVKKIKEAIS